MGLEYLITAFQGLRATFPDRRTGDNAAYE